MKQIEPESLEKFPDSLDLFDEDMADDDAQGQASGPTMADREAMMNLAFERVRAHVAEKSWNLFCDITIKGMPTAEAALKYGMQYSAAHKSNARILQRVRANGKMLGLGSMAEVSKEANGGVAAINCRFVAMKPPSNIPSRMAS